MGHLVAAPDKFRGTASASAVARAVAATARRAGWSADAAPMADGGEGFFDVAGGRKMTTWVPGPSGVLLHATWRILDGDDLLDPADGPAAVIEMAQAAGLSLAGGRDRNRPLEATTRGVGALLLAAVEAGVSRVLVGCGGSATTDGGWGALKAIGDPSRLRGVEVLVACDVSTPFVDAAKVFGPQKGATPEGVAMLTARLEALAVRYQQDWGVDVTAITSSGAGGGLAGGLAEFGARLVPGAALVADLVDLDRRLARADLVVTGEEHLDQTSFAGKVVSEVIARTPSTTPVLCVVGDADQSVLDQAHLGREHLDQTHLGRKAEHGATAGTPVRVVSLVTEFGATRAVRETTELVATVVGRELAGERS